MRAGTLNCYVTLESQSGQHDAAGQPIDQWYPVANLWARIGNISGSEAIRADQQVSTVRTNIRIRWRRDILPDMRIVHGDNVYQIKAVLPAEDDRDRVDLVCELHRG